MTEFETKEQMVNEWVKERAHDYDEDKHSDNVALARIESRNAAVYVPHVYRGGWVIRGFGYSTERIGKYIEAEKAGKPELV